MKIGIIVVAIIAISLIPLINGQIITASNDWNEPCYDSGYRAG
jgi:hypothetical protein